MNTYSIEFFEKITPFLIFFMIFMMGEALLLAYLTSKGDELGGYIIFALINLVLVLLTAKWLGI